MIMIPTIADNQISLLLVTDYHLISTVDIKLIIFIAQISYTRTSDNLHRTIFEQTIIFSSFLKLCRVSRLVQWDDIPARLIQKPA